MRVQARWLSVAIGFACQKDPSTPTAAPNVEQPQSLEEQAMTVAWPSTAPSRETVVDAWTAAGLKASGLGAVDGKPFGAQGCAAGLVADLDVLICAYTDEKNRLSGAGATRAREWAEGARTLLLDGQGATLLAVADRANVDPRGDTIERVADVFKRVER